MCSYKTTVFEDMKRLLQRMEMNSSIYFVGRGELRIVKQRYGALGKVLKNVLTAVITKARNKISEDC